MRRLLADRLHSEVVQICYKYSLTGAPSLDAPALAQRLSSVTAPGAFAIKAMLDGSPCLRWRCAACSFPIRRQASFPLSRDCPSAAGQELQHPQVVQLLAVCFQIPPLRPSTANFESYHLGRCCLDSGG